MMEMLISDEEENRYEYHRQQYIKELTREMKYIIWYARLRSRIMPVVYLTK